MPGPRYKVQNGCYNCAHSSFNNLMWFCELHPGKDSYEALISSGRMGVTEEEADMYWAVDHAVDPCGKCSRWSARQDEREVCLVPFKPTRSPAKADPADQPPA